MIYNNSSFFQVQIVEEEVEEEEVVEEEEDEVVEVSMGGMVLHTIKPHSTQPPTTHNHTTTQDPITHNIMGAPAGNSASLPQLSNLLVKLANV